MKNELISSASDHLVRILNEDRSGLVYISGYLNKKAEDDDNRKLIGNHSFTDGIPQQSIMERLFDDASFEWGDSINQKILNYLGKSPVLTGREKVVKRVLKEVPSSQTKKIAALIALRGGGAEIIKSNSLYDLSTISYPVVLQCGLCGHATTVNYTFEDAENELDIKEQCSKCDHTPSDDCRCEHCSSSHVVFDMAKVIESRVNNVLVEANKEIERRTNEKVQIDFDVDLSSLLSRFLAFRGGMSKDANRVVEKAVEVFKATNRFEFNTYTFVQNVIGGDGEIKKIAGELIRSGFYYKRGMTLKKNGTSFASVKLISNEDRPRLYMLADGDLCVSSSPVSDAFDSVDLFSVGCESTLSIEWEKEPFAYDEFSVNQWALEHLSHGGVYSTKTQQQDLPGMIMTDELVRKCFLSELKKTNNYLFPNVKIASLVKVEDALRFLNSTSVTLLENFEAALVAFGEDFQPKCVYVYKGHSGINLFSQLIEPNLIASGIKVIYI